MERKPIAPAPAECRTCPLYRDAMCHLNPVSVPKLPGDFCSYHPSYGPRPGWVNK